MLLLTLACPLRSSGLHPTNERNEGVMNKTPTIQNELGTLIITGSSGLIGSAFLDRVGESYRTMGFDRKGPPHPLPKTAHVIACDLSLDESVYAALDEVRRLRHRRIASILHLAAYYSFASESSPLYEQVTVRGTERLLRGLRDFEVEQFIFASTMLVHAPCEPGARINEDWPLKPKWDYPKSKVAAERLILRERGDVPVVLMRIGGVYDDRCHSIPSLSRSSAFTKSGSSAVFFPATSRMEWPSCIWRIWSRRWYLPLNIARNYPK